jgi:hypothetical protein
LSQYEISRLKANKVTFWLAGFPYNTQEGEGDDSGNMIRQELATDYIGENSIETNDTVGLQNVLTATDKKDSDGAMCTWGMSGAEGLTVRVRRLLNGHLQRFVKIIGNFIAFDSYTPLQEIGGSEQSWTPAYARASKIADRQDFPSANWKGVDGTCSYNYQSILKNTGSYI